VITTLLNTKSCFRGHHINSYSNDVEKKIIVNDVKCPWYIVKKIIYEKNEKYEELYAIKINIAN